MWFHGRSAGEISDQSHPSSECLSLADASREYSRWQQSGGRMMFEINGREQEHLDSS